MQLAHSLTAKTVFFLLDRAPRRHVGMLARAMMTRYVKAPISELDVIGTALKHSSNVAAAINDLVLKTSPADVISSVDRLISLRDAAINKLFTATPRVDSVLVREWLTLTTDNHTGSIAANRIEQHIRNFSLYEGRHRARFEVLTLHVLIKAQRDDLLGAFFQESSHYSWSNVPVVCKIGILRCVLKNNPASYARVRELMAGPMSKLDELKLLELDIAGGYVDSVPRHHEITKQFMHAAPPQVAQDFETLIKPFFDSRDQSLMDARTNKKTQLKLEDTIDSHVRSGKPLSLIRIGDGEAYAYAGDNKYLTKEDIRIREDHWWGLQLDERLRARIQSQVREAIEQTDYMGVPSIYRFIRDTQHNSINIKSSTALRYLVAVISSVRPRIGARIVEDRIHHVMFSLDWIRKLSRGVVASHVISSVRPDIVNGFGLRANTITVPTHNKTRTNELFQAVGKPLPFVYEDIIDEIRSSVRPGDLVLVSAGIIGKIFIHEACKRGAIALDVGSMVDYWAGAKTRSIADLV